MVMLDPINQIQWMKASELNANGYNPNVVFTPELRLLERSILKTGWVQPILISPTRTIIDGFHRWRLSIESPALVERYAGSVPTAMLDVDEREARILTVRMNRAKGVHVALRMSELVRDLVDEGGMDQQEVALEIGATPLEVKTLYDRSLLKARNLAEYKYSEAWTPRMERTRMKQRAR
jgi:ParB-like chromosome segregation protein Spo0J